MKFAYARVSSTCQNLDRQIEALTAQGIEEANIFADKVSGAKEKREGLDNLLSHLREGDSVTILSFDRLARSTKQLLELSEQFQERGVDLISLKEDVDTSTPQGKLVFTVFAAISEFQRNIIKESQAEGIAAAKKLRGKCGGRPKLDPEKMEAAVTLYLEGSKPVSKISEITGISSSSLYRELEKRGLKRAS